MNIISRNINTDVLLGMLSRSMPLRKRLSEAETAKWNSLSLEERADFDPPLKPLKLVIMSATLRVDDFKTPVLFGAPPPAVIQVKALHGAL